MLFFCIIYLTFCFVDLFLFSLSGLCSGCGDLSLHHPVRTPAESAAAQWHRTHLFAGPNINTHTHTQRGLGGGEKRKREL